MITMEQVETRRTGGPSRAGRPAVRVPAARPVVRDRRGPARSVSVPVQVRGTAACGSPVRRAASAPQGVLRRAVAGLGLLVASAAAVVGLGLLADVAEVSAASAPAGAPVPAVAQP